MSILGVISNESKASTRDEPCVAHLDADAFYVSVELNRHPELRGLPVVVAWRADSQASGRRGLALARP